MREMSIGCLPGVFVFRFPLGQEDLETVNKIYQKVRSDLIDYGQVIGMPDFATLKFLQKNELVSLRAEIDNCLKQIDRSEKLE